MMIQINTDDHISGTETLRIPISDTISNELDRFADQITRVEVHLGDENSNKSGPGDKRCMLEARLEGMRPIAVTSHSDTIEQAVSEAVEKLKASLETAIGRLKKY
jgi:ribosome-associated translation inhibitor RaiA